MAGGRTLTVLVADVVGSTELFGRLGVDRADHARRALFSAFSAAIGESNGVLIKTMGDGCLASFGSAADGVKAAVALQRAAAGLREHNVAGLELRVGVAVGDVTEEDDDVFGPVVVTASRLCGAADEHGILATDMVRMLAGDRGGHRFAEAGEFVLKGLPDPVLACTILVDAATGVRPFPRALASTPAELVVGRAAELAVLSNAFKAATGGERRAVLVAGEPGVGKTRLLAALARRAHDDGATVLFGRCEEDLAVPFQPFAQALRTGIAGLDPAAVQAHVAAHGGEIRRLVPTVDAPEPLRAEPALEQARLFDAVTDLLHRAAEHRPVVLVLDDLHWAAPSTVALLRHLLAADPDHGLCVLGTYRDTEIDRSHALGGLLADVHRISGVERLALRGLDAQGIEDLLTAASGDELDDRSRPLAAAIVERTAGNPFFATELLRNLVERRVVGQDGGRWTIRGPLDDVDLPEGVLDVVGRRLSRLSPAANQALAVAAVAGSEFAVRVLSEVPDAGGVDAVVDGLDEAVRARMLAETGPGRFAFTHAIVRDALARELTLAKRARLHRALGEAILAVYRDAPDAPLADLAHHFTEAAVLGDSSAAAHWSTAAAAAAVDQADHRGAVAVLEHALAVIETVEPVDQAARFDVAAAAAECRYALAERDVVAVGSAVEAARRLNSGERLLRIAMARYNRGTGVTDPEGIELYDEALELLDPAAAPLRAYAVASRAARRSIQSDRGFTDDVDRANELLAGIGANAPKLAAAARVWLVSATLGLPGAEHRLRVCDHALALDPATPDPWSDRLGSGLDTGGAVQLLRGHALLALGRRAEFESNLALVTELGEMTGNLGVLGAARARVALLALLDGRFGDVPIHANKMLELGPSRNENDRSAYFGLLGMAAIEQGHVAELLPMIEASIGASPDLPAFQATIGRLRLDAGDRDGAAVVLDRLAGGWTGWARDWTWPLALAQTAEIVAGLETTDQAHPLADELGSYTGELAVVGLGIMCLGALDRYRGMVLGLLGDHDEAVAALEGALEVEESVESPPFIARTRYWLARALLRRDEHGDRERAAEELGRSIRAAARLGMAGLARAGRALADPGG